jgi:hypothetical protein
MLPAMSKDISINDFGLLIAYVLPGFTTLWGATYLTDSLSPWLGTTDTSPTIGGFLFVTLASVGAGLAVSTLRWLVVDTCHRLTGIRRPDRDFARLEANVAAFGVLVDGHYRYYQHYGNMLVAILFVLAARRAAVGLLATPFGGVDAALAGAAVLYFLGSRDALLKYYARTGALLGRPEHRRRSHRGKAKQLGHGG